METAKQLVSGAQSRFFRKSFDSQARAAKKGYNVAVSFTF